MKPDDAQRTGNPPWQWEEGRLVRRLVGRFPPEARQGWFAAVAFDGRPGGSLVIPYEHWTLGSTLYLPFHATAFCRVYFHDETATLAEYYWDGHQWAARPPTLFGLGPLLPVGGEGRGAALILNLPHGAQQVALADYSKLLAPNHGWGQLVESGETVPPGWRNEGFGDQALTGYWLYRPGADGGTLTPHHRFEKERWRIYQLFVRLFGNTRETTRPGGTLKENGVGTFNDITDDALASLRGLGLTHLWLAGVLRQATGTAYPGAPADDPDLLKGVAGSPYAVKDPWDLSPDYASAPEKRWAEFRALLKRARRAGLKTLIDLVPNHLARSAGSTLFPQFAFGSSSHHGRGDRKDRFFDPQNHFFYLQPDANGPPLRLPTAGKPGCDGLYEPERSFGRVTGNNVASWQPHSEDWYETVKLNYGYDFTTGQTAFPHAGEAGAPLPDTWLKMDHLIAHWQQQGVDGFRCDMAHLVPPEFWAWAIPRARYRQPEVIFVAEAYDDDPAAVPSRNGILRTLCGGGGSATVQLLDAGFDAVYGDDVRKVLKAIYDGPAWANDLDAVLLRDPLLGPNALRFAENHDEVRLAAEGEWGGIGMEVGRPVSAILYALSCGPVLVYNGQEVGENAGEGSARGFGGDKGRTSIFDYGVMPELARWANDGKFDGGGLSDDQAALRAFYGRLLTLMDEPAFRRGVFLPLNGANLESEHFGRLPGEAAGGHWMYAFIRHDAHEGQAFLVVANLHRSQAFRDVDLRLSPEALLRLGWREGTPVRLTDRLAPSMPLRLAQSAEQIVIPLVPPLTAFYFELSPVAAFR
ncbi:MAG TPA: alpha-amylase family glycosyl hydrolase [Chthoniobacteraceae bacterium]|nr:alpha-amylase family glycosyl hydrolase [Chthoniobacteraceae bacterium]